MLRYSPMILPSELSSRYSNLNSFWVTMTSPSMPITSVTLVVRREPSRRRFTCTMRSTESAIWRLMASLGILMSPIITMFSIRARHSRGLLEWSVAIEPSWPVFIAASRSKHSDPRISPRMMRSGGMARARVRPRVRGGGQVEALRSADLAEDDAIGAHAERVLDEIADRDLALAFEVWRAGFERQPVRLLKPELGRVLDGEHALARINELGKGV